jgi:hypothetical protein
MGDLWDWELGVFTSTWVRDGAPILTVFHDRDGDWQFLSNREQSGAEAVLVHVGHLVDEDPTLRDVADLPIGWKAWRVVHDGDWTRNPIPDNQEDVPD